ncbi:MAG: NDP-sugar synthase [Rubrobacteridae bacterium]|nr:NDP-sugar synthase [Rubrobacteridae bacterium]
MRAFLMAAGLGERLAPLTLSKPKALMPIANRPVIARLFDMLQPYGFDETYVSLHLFPDAVKDIVGNGSEWGTQVHYSIEPEPEGTAGGIARIAKFLEGDRFLLMNTDIVTDIDLNPAFSYHEKTGAKMTLVMTDQYADDPKLQEQLIGVGADGRILTDREPGSDVKGGIYTGMAICEPSIIGLIPKGYSTLLDSVLLPLAAEGSLYGCFTGGYWRDIGTVDNYMRANFDAIGGLVKMPVSGRLLGENVWIDETAEIDFTVQIEEPVLIGKGVTIERGAKIGPNAVIADKCEIGPKVEISQSVIWGNCKIEGSTTITSSIIAEEQKISHSHKLRRVILHGGVSEAIFNI